MLKNKYKKILILLIVVSLFNLNVIKTNAQDFTHIYAKAAIAIDLNNQSILYCQNGDEKIGLASITKFFVATIALEKIEKEKINLEEQVTISNNAASIKNITNSSGVYFNEGQQVTIKKLLELMMVYSDNGASVALSEHLYGTEANCLAEINSYVKESNLENTNFVNVTGLDEDNGTYNYSTAKEITRMAIKCLNISPEITEYTKIPFVEFLGYEYPSFNLMLPEELFYYEGITGLKTGTTNTAGPSFLGLYEKDNKKILTLISGAHDASGQPDDYGRFKETKKLLDYVITINTKVIIPEKTIISTDLKKGFGNIKLETQSNLSYNDNINCNLVFDKIEYFPEYVNDGKIIKEINQGTTIGYLYLRSEDNITTNYSLYTENGIIKIPLTTVENIKPESIIEKFIFAIPNFLINIYNNLL